MLYITIPESEGFDENTNEFLSIKEQTLQLEHSLVSLSKWESKWNKPFLGKDQKTKDETLDYIRCMTITQNVDPRVYNFITNDSLDAISDYIEAPMTATKVFRNDKSPIKKETITSEVIYYWMIALNIPPEYQKWHLNRLITLIDVCNVKNAPPKKVKPQEVLSRNKELNDARRKALNSKG